MKPCPRPFAILLLLILSFLTSACAENPNPDHINLTDVGGSYYPSPGYKWVNNSSGNLAVVWTPGIPYAQNGSTLYPHVLSANNVGLWYPAPGYKWAHLDASGSPIAGDFSVQWDPGRDYSQSGTLVYPNVIAAYAEGSWYPAPGYVWQNVDASGNPIGFIVRWSPDTAYSYLGTITFAHITAAENPGGWYPEPGYEWVRHDADGHPTPGDLYVTWHPRDSYYYHGQLKWPNLQAANTEGIWYPAPGYVWSHTDASGSPVAGDLSVHWQPGITSNALGQVENANILSSDKEREWHPAPGYLWAHPDDKSDFTVIAQTRDAPAAEPVTRSLPAPPPTPAPIAAPPAAPPSPDDQPRPLK